MSVSSPVFHLAHKVELILNDRQRTSLAKAAGTARFAYNWALEEWKTQYEECQKNPKLKKPSEGALRKQLNAIKRQEFPWMLDVTKCAPQMAIMQLGDAFKNFFAGRAKYPQFRRKGVDDRFTLTNDQFKVKGRKLHIPHLGEVEMREELRFKGKITSATISRKADRWFVSINVELSDLSHLKPAENQGVVGVDLGISALATFSTGEAVEGPKPLKRLMRKVRRLSKSVSRKEKGSANRQKEKEKLAKTHAKIANIRKDGLHKLTTDLTSRFHTIVIEDLNVSGMVMCREGGLPRRGHYQKNRKLSRAISDMGFYEFRRQLTYKAEMRGGEVVVADRFFPSSKLCSECGDKLEELSLSVRKWTCPGCEACHDRDVNAALNLKNLVKITASSAV